MSYMCISYKLTQQEYLSGDRDDGLQRTVAIKQDLLNILIQLSKTWYIHTVLIVTLPCVSWAHK